MPERRKAYRRITTPACSRPQHPSGLRASLPRCISPILTRRFIIDVVASNGRHVRWAVENSGTLAMTRRRGFDEMSLQVGDPIEVCGYAPKRP